MIARFRSRRTVWYGLFNLIFVFILILSTSTRVMASGDEVLPEIRALLQNQYVDPVSAEVLAAPDRGGNAETARRSAYKLFLRGAIPGFSREY